MNSYQKLKKKEKRKPAKAAANRTLSQCSDLADVEFKDLKGEPAHGLAWESPLRSVDYAVIQIRNNPPHKMQKDSSAAFVDNTELMRQTGWFQVVLVLPAR
eukprot:TRINITY_DN61013_c0_g1_i1.p1 TRINITY_DN61013_c0_g1~~TRINITY_DN61013_c0_g1_i1.p1  ORF type:complete len:101 (+),score=17.79 TRINITY_DN61013_c0_g1_i1:33-335(+)